MTNEHAGAEIFWQFLPMLVIGLIFGILMAIVARKIGKNPVLWFILSAIPLVNFVFLWIAIWRCVISLHRRVAALEQAAAQNLP